MPSFIRVGAILHCLLLIAAERPRFRDDYKFEKSFNSFYKLHTSATNWFEARIRCQAEGAELLVPGTLDEADSVPILTTSVLSKFEGIFVGIHDLYSERSFVTLSGSEMLVSILNLLWEYRQPEHSAGRCVAMRRTGRLFVYPCDSGLPFICKVNADKVHFQEECQSFNPRWQRDVNETSKCYFMHHEPQTWFQAYGTCLSAGGHLAIINDKHEADLLKHMFKQTDQRRIPDNDFAFLGFNDLFLTHHFRTIQGTRIEELAYKDWEPKSCSNSRGGNSSGSEFRCGGMKRTGLLSTWDCNIPAMFFCEKAANATKRTMLRNGPATVHRHHHRSRTTQGQLKPLTFTTRAVGSV